MKFQTYIYGRTQNIDFREICSPQKRLSPQMVSLVKEIINTDVISNGDINRLRYLFVRDSGRVLFGVGFNHLHYLDKELQTDFSGRRALRSFVGIVVDECEFENLQSLPICSDFFISLYLRYIQGVWHLEDRSKNRDVIISEITEQEPEDNWCRLDGNMSFNADNNVCKFFNPTEEHSVLSSIKRCTSNIIIGLNVETHVLTALRRFNVNISNVLCLDTVEEHCRKMISKTDKGLRQNRKKADGKKLAPNIVVGGINESQEHTGIGGKVKKIFNNISGTAEEHSTKGKKHRSDCKERGGKDLQPDRQEHREPVLTDQKADVVLQENDSLAILEDLKISSKNSMGKQRTPVIDDEDTMDFNWGGDSLDDSSKIDTDKVPVCDNCDSTEEKDNAFASHSGQTLENGLSNDTSEVNSNSDARTDMGIKKKLSPKLILCGVILTLIAIVLAIGRCCKSNQTNPQKSVSGDTMKTVKIMKK